MVFQKSNTAPLQVSLCLAALLALAGCQPYQMQSEFQQNPADSLSGRQNETDRHMLKEAEVDMASGRTREAVPLFARLHQKHPQDGVLALTYAAALRKTGKPEQAIQVLTPYVADKGGTTHAGADPAMLTELAAANIGLGRFDRAEKLLDQVTADPKAAAHHPDAYSLMGIALDAQGHHKEAEQMFHQALDNWKGDPAPVMNNLGLCLASQGEFDPALDVLRKALVLSPNDKPEIARNIQMITDLRGSLIKKPVVITPVDKHPVKGKKKKKTACPAPCVLPGKPKSETP
jgi:Flp pilus assembly protein TadD